MVVPIACSFCEKSYVCLKVDFLMTYQPPDNHGFSELANFINILMNALFFLFYFSVSVPSENIQNAYIVAVEEDAKRRLEELVYNHKLTPVDISEDVSEPFSYTSSDNLLSSSSPDLSLEEAVLLASMPYSTHSQPMTNGHVEMSEINGFRDDKPKKGKGDKGKKSHRTGSAGTTETPMINNLLTSNMHGSSENSLDKSIDNSSFSDPHSSIDMDDGPHREMAIDVPANFHGKSKSPPKYPSNRSSPQSNHSTPLKSKDNAQNSKPPSSEEQMERIRKTPRGDSKTS